MRRAFGIVAAACVGLAALPAAAAEPYIEFVRGLRDKQYYDVAIEYLERIETDPQLPADVKELVPYEKALTLLDGAKTIKNLEAQTRQLDAAEAFLEQFTKQSPNHPKAGTANTQRAEILLGKARVEVLQARSPANSGNRAPFQTKARDLVAKARTIYQTAHDQHKANYEKFPPYIDKDKDGDLYDERRNAEMNFIQAQLDLAKCRYEEAQTFDPKDPEFKNTLIKASQEFEAMHQRYRSQVGGLFARMWQAKCFEEQEDLGKALGIYNELLGHPGKSESMHRLQDQVTQFRLICLNHDLRKDYQLVIQEANEWLAQNKTRSRSAVGIGIRWEKARAEEAIGTKRDLSQKERDAAINAALVEAREINKFQGQYKDVSTLMIQRLNALKGKGGSDPKDFDTALGIGRSMVKQIKDLQDSVTGAQRSGKPQEEVAKAQSELDAHVKETARILKLALELADSSTDTTQHNVARHMLSYVYYITKQNYESAILGEFIAQRYPTDDPNMALESAFIAMAAWQQAYYSVPRGQSRETEMNQMIRVCNLIAKNWPDQDRANDARMTLGQLYSDADQPAESGRWFGQVPETAAQYPNAQINAGQAYWTAYLKSAIKKEAERPAKEVLDQWQAAAEKHLTTGIEKIGATIPKDGTPPPEMVAAKVSLAQIKINKGEYNLALNLLVGDPHPVNKSIEVKEGEQRPEHGVKGKGLFILTYTLLLRCYVSTQDIEKALAAMGQLEAQAGGARGEGVMKIYEDLGQALEKEIDIVQGAGDQKRLSELQTSFNKFLEELYKRKDTMSYSGLAWIAETYTSLGKGMSEQKDVSSDYFRRAAATYGDIIARAETGTKPEDVDFKEKKLEFAKLRLVAAKRLEGDFQGSFELITTLLKGKPNALDAQFEAAQVLQDWGMSGQGDSFKKLLEARRGVPAESAQKGHVWGWGATASRLQKLMEAGKAKPDQAKLYFESGYNQALCRFHYGKAQSTTQQRAGEYQGARKELEAFVRVAGDMPEAMWDKFDTLYRDIQKEENPAATPVALAKPEVAAAPPEEKTAETPDETEKPKTAENDQPKAAEAQAESGGVGAGTIVVLLLVLLGGGGGIGYMVLKKPKPKRRGVTAATGAAAPSFNLPAFEMPTNGAAKPAAKPRTAAAPVVAAGATAARKPDGAPAARPAAKPAAAGAKPAAKPPAAGAKPAPKPGT